MIQYDKINLERKLKMFHNFKTKAEAIATGYRSPNRAKDKDTSGPNSFGYSFMNEEGEETVTVWLSEAINKAGHKGAFVVMYPPK